MWLRCSDISTIPILHHLLQPEQSAGFSHRCLGKILPVDPEDIVRQKHGLKQYVLRTLKEFI